MILLKLNGDALASFQDLISNLCVFLATRIRSSGARRQQRDFYTAQAKLSSRVNNAAAPPPSNPYGHLCELAGKETRGARHVRTLCLSDLDKLRSSKERP